MKWEKNNFGKLPVKSWCADLENGVLQQVANLANHPAVFKHIALMPDCHLGFGMPIGGVIACQNAVIPNAVGVDIGCGVRAVRTNLRFEQIEKKTMRNVLDAVKKVVPFGEGNAHKKKQICQLLDSRSHKPPGGIDLRSMELAYRNIGTLGGGNHFIEIQKGEDSFIWLMIHSGSRNLGYKIAEHYHKLALDLNLRYKMPITNKQLAYLPTDSDEGLAYIKDMEFALDYARENRCKIMTAFKEKFQLVNKNIAFDNEIDIHHNYASLETHFGHKLWIHRKGATSATLGEKGIIPGSMGTASYIVEGLGNPESFMSCSHGAGRKLGRAEACRSLSKEECEKAMEGIIFDGFKSASGRFGRKSTENKFFDLEEAPLAYKNIEEVIESELDLIKPLLRLVPLAVLKG